MAYTAPVDDIIAALRSSGLNEGLEHGFYESLGEEDARDVVEEAGKFANTRLAPLNRLGDSVGAKLADGKVTLPAGWAEAYRDWCAAGWNALDGPADFAGQDLPALLNAAATEIWNGANMAFGLCPMLTKSAIEALHAHGTAELQKRYLQKLVSGEWSGTMLLTESQAGSDLAQIRMRAVKSENGTYKLSGTKIYITYGEHDMTPNILHFILARTSNDGIKGLSLFLVPKVLDDGARNDIHCAGLEHKLGIHGSPTCTMVAGDKGGATGYLIGEEGRGIQCMFTMMNSARLGVGLQGVGIAEAAFQHALHYARERQQGKTLSGAPTIIGHGDVLRMLTEMRAKIMVARLICYKTAFSLDAAQFEKEELTRGIAADRAALLTPIAKAFSTDIANEVASLGIQVHGGMGFIEETGAAQFYRDARIAAIYEGTNGIQANDLVGRKLNLRGGGIMNEEVKHIRDIAQRVDSANNEAFGSTSIKLTHAAHALQSTSAFLISSGPEKAQNHSVAFLRLAALAIGGAALAKLALDQNDAALVSLARYFAEHHVVMVEGLQHSITESAPLDADIFSAA